MGGQSAITSLTFPHNQLLYIRHVGSRQFRQVTSTLVTVYSTLLTHADKDQSPNRVLTESLSPEQLFILPATADFSSCPKWAAQHCVLSF